MNATTSSNAWNATCRTIAPTLVALRA